MRTCFLLCDTLVLSPKIIPFPLAKKDTPSIQCKTIYGEEIATRRYTAERGKPAFVSGSTEVAGIERDAPGKLREGKGMCVSVEEKARALKTLQRRKVGGLMCHGDGVYIAESAKSLIIFAHPLFSFSCHF